MFEISVIKKANLISECDSEKVTVGRLQKATIIMFNYKNSYVMIHVISRRSHITSFQRGNYLICLNVMLVNSATMFSGINESVSKKLKIIICNFGKAV